MDRTPGTAPQVQLANQFGTVFSGLDCTPRWRERLPEIKIPILVVHGRRDPVLPPRQRPGDHARDPRGAAAHPRPIILDQAATAIPDTAADQVAEAMLTLG